MGIRFYCPECGRRLNVKSFLAGKRGICPHCDGRFEVPLENQLPAGAPKQRPAEEMAAIREVTGTNKSKPTPAAELFPDDVMETPAATSVLADPIADAPNAVWYVKPPGAEQYGPADGELMRQWLREGRVSVDAIVWREGWDNWRDATDVFDVSALKGGDMRLERRDRAAAEVKLDAAALDSDEDLETDSAVKIPARPVPRRPRSRSLLPLIVLGLLIVALLVVTVVVVSRNST